MSAVAPPVLVRGPRTGAAATVTSWSLHLPGADPHPASLPAALVGLIGDACPPERAGSVLGRKGLLCKEPATRLALLAVHAALGARSPGRLRTRTAVVACGNLGNVETVVNLARTVRRGSVRDLSPLAAPNASSNVLASTVAQWFGLAGPNVMVCSGAVAGLDGLDIAVRILAAGRADQVVLAAAEPADEVATIVHAGPGRTRLCAGAACVVIEPATATGPGPLGWADLVVGPEGFDPTTAWGDSYGAQGVVSLALASAAVAAGRARAAAVSCGDRHDGWRTARVWAAAGAERS